MSEERFTDFLVEKGIITKDIILELLIDQYMKIPSTLEIVISKKLLPIYKTFKIFEILDKHGFDFKAAAQELGMWSDEIQEALNKERSRYKLPLGQIIVRRKLATTHQMVEYLEEFNGEKIGELSPHDQRKKEKELFDELSDEIPTADSFEVQFMAIDTESLNDYMGTVDGEKRNEIERLILDWEKLPNDRAREKEVRDNVHSVKREYHTIKGSSRFIRAALIEGITHEAEDLIVEFEDHFFELDEKFKEQMTNLNLRILDVVWDILDCLQKNQSEEPYWEIEQKRQNIFNIVQEMKRLKAIITG